MIIKFERAPAPYTERRRTPRKKPRKKLEFFQKVIIVLVVLSSLTTAASYVLAAFDKQTVETLSTEVFKTLWGGTEVGLGAYALLHSVRAVTSAKYGLFKGEEEKARSDVGNGTSNANNSVATADNDKEEAKG